jgi:ubiquitin-like protein Pup
MSEVRRAEAPSKRLEESEQSAHASLADKGEKIKAELDSLLDEVDDVLEENAEDFVKSYVQRGGQ